MSKTTRTTNAPKTVTSGDILEGDETQQHASDTPFSLRLLTDLKAGMGTLNDRTLRIQEDVNEVKGNIRDLRSEVRGDIARLQDRDVKEIRDDVKALRDTDMVTLRRDLWNGLNSKVSSKAFWAGVGIIIALVSIAVRVIMWLVPLPFGT